jgi:hypothetical protein
VLSGEQQGRALPPEILLERRRIALQFGLQIGVGGFGEELERGFEVVCAGQQLPPRL